jgi:transposase
MSAMTLFPRSSLESWCRSPMPSISKETRAYLASVPNRFDFVFTPKHGSWLNLAESFFGKLAKTLLRGIRVNSKAELRARIELYLQEVNEEPVVFKWKYKLETLPTESVVT